MNPHPAVEASINLQPLIREHLVEGEERARLTPEVVTAVGRAGLFRLYAPREVGGLEVLPSDAVAAIEAVLAEFKDPETGRSIVQMGQASDIQVSGSDVSLKLGLTSWAAPIAADVQSALEQHLQSAFSEAAIHVKQARHDRPPQLV